MLPVSLYNGMEVNLFYACLHYITSIKYCNVGSAIYVTLFLFVKFNYETLLTSHCAILHPHSLPQATRKLWTASRALLSWRNWEAIQKFNLGRICLRFIVDSNQTSYVWNCEDCPPCQIPGRDVNPDPAKEEAEAADNSAWVLDTYNY